MPGSKLYTIEYLDVVVENDIPVLSTSAKSLIKRAIEASLMQDPLGYGKPLRYSLKGHRRLRVSDCRVIYRIDGEKKKVIVVAIKHRQDFYDES